MNPPAAVISHAYAFLWAVLSAYYDLTERLFEKDEKTYMFVYHRGSELAQRREELAWWLLDTQASLHSFDLQLTREEALDLYGRTESSCGEFLSSWCERMVVTTRATHPTPSLPWNILLHVYYCGAVASTLLRFDAFVQETAQPFPQLRLHHEQHQAKWRDMAHIARLEIDQVLQVLSVPDPLSVSRAVLSSGDDLAQSWELATITAANEYIRHYQK
jgi:hypothetical protein